MGRPVGRKAGARTKNKTYRKRHSTRVRAKDVDQIQDELRREREEGRATAFAQDDDLPGQGQFYCTPCARHFQDEGARDTHLRTKVHKRRMKDVAQEQYTQEEADRAAGKTKEELPPAHGGAAAGASAMES